MTDQDRITVLEVGTAAILEAIQGLEVQMGTITAHLTSNGGLSVIWTQGRVKFTGSLPVKKFVGWTAALIGSLGAVAGVLVKLLEPW